jgi:type I restriction enzyme S subunit
VPPDLDGANCIDLVFARPRKDLITSFFLSRYFNSEEGKRQALSQKTELAQQHLNVAAVKRTLVPVPTIDEQHESVRSLEGIDQKITAEEARLQSLDELFRSLVHHLLTGQLRIQELELPVAVEAV